MKAQVQVLKAGTYRVFVQAPISKPGLKIRAGSKVNGIALNTTARDFYERNTFVLKKDARKVTFDIRIDSPKRDADKPSLVLVKLEKRSDGSLKFVRQQIPSNWKIALSR